MGIQKTARTHTGINKYQGAWDKEAKMHLLRRTMFGATLSDLKELENKSLSDTIDQLLDNSVDLPTPPLNYYQSERNNDPNVPLGQTWINDTFGGQFNGQRRNSWAWDWIGNQINQSLNIREKMTLFWHNHFATEASIYAYGYFAYEHTKLLRENYLGDFKELVKKITLDKAMLRYLNGEKNQAKAPDENYARELQELFTLGKGEDAKYTESDIIEAAKVLTGWRINYQTGEVYFTESRHYDKNKVFSKFYGNYLLRAGSSQADAEKEIDDLIEMIFTKKEVAKFLVRRLYMWFIYYEIDEATETNFIEPLADLFFANNFDVKLLMKYMLQSEHFFDPANRACLIKSPLDYLVGFCRQFELEFPKIEDDVENTYRMWGYIYYLGSVLQQTLGGPPSVSGWPAYHQMPSYHELWINTDTLPKRVSYVENLIWTGYKRNQFRLQVDTIKITSQTSQPGDPNQLIEDLLTLLTPVDVSEETKMAMKSILLSNQSLDSYWTDAWLNYTADPSNETFKNTVESRLKLLFAYIIKQSEYQLS